MKTMRTALICAMAAAALMGCDRIGNPFEAMGGKLPPPDEFRVVTRKPLKMPSTISLPEPRLGERSPLDHDPKADAAAALTGGRGVAAGTSATGASVGERALLTAARANADTKEIEARLIAAETKADANKPYEPPTLLQLFYGADEVDLTDALDPNIEARRLQAEGVAPAPINPSDKPAEEE